MDVIRHDDKRMESILSEIPLCVPKGIHNNLCDLRPPKPARSMLSSIQVTVDPDKRLSTSEAVRRNVAMAWKGVVKAPRQEQVPSFRMPVRQAAMVETHFRCSAFAWQNSHASHSPAY